MYLLGQNQERLCSWPNKTFVEHFPCPVFPRAFPQFYQELDDWLAWWFLIETCWIFDENYKNSQRGVHMQFFGVQAFNFLPCNVLLKIRQIYTWTKQKIRNNSPRLQAEKLKQSVVKEKAKFVQANLYLRNFSLLST